MVVGVAKPAQEAKGTFATFNALAAIHSPVLLQKVQMYQVFVEVTKRVFWQMETYYRMVNHFNPIVPCSVPVKED